MRAIRFVVPLLVLLTAAPAAADGPRLEIQFTPTERLTYAIWISSADGARFRTIQLTEAVGRYGIGNRPGARQMNSGFHWPYGRREGALPIWAHARVASGAPPFRRVIFQQRIEGYASRDIEDSEDDDYFCLPFRLTDTPLDAVSCASIFRADRGRFITPRDISSGYGEPFETRPVVGMMLPLDEHSLYPPRHEMTRVPLCDGLSEPCNNHPDVREIYAEAARVMPEIDEVTRATAVSGVPYEVVFEVPEDWPDGDYVLWLEASKEADFNDSYNDTVMPTPTSPASPSCDGRPCWDGYAIDSGFATRGQPAIVYRIPLRVDGAGGVFHTDRPFGYGEIHGLDGEIRPIDSTITDDPTGHPGSGADRLLVRPDGHRIHVNIPVSDICLSPERPPECDMECSDSVPCPAGFICGETGMCVGICDIDIPPDAVLDFTVSPHADEKHSHHWAEIGLTVPASRRELRRYEIRYSTEPIVDEASFTRAMPAHTASIAMEDLVIPGDEHTAGDRIEVAMGGLAPQTHYFVAVRAIDECNDRGTLATAEVTTTEIHFTTVSPCFVATAAYGTPMADEIRALRRLRDRHLLSNAPGRALVGVYEVVGPPLADVIRDQPALRAAARLSLVPFVTLARSLD